MKLIKGSKAAREYMAKIRAKKKVSGLDKVVRKGNKTSVQYTNITGARKKAAPKKAVQAKLFGVPKNDPTNLDYYLHEIKLHGNKRLQAMADYAKNIELSLRANFRADKLKYTKFAADAKKLVVYYTKQIKSLKIKLK